MTISPKVYAPLVVALLASTALYFLTGDESFLVAILLQLIAGGVGVAVAPAPGVDQVDIDDVSQGRATIVPADAPTPTAPTGSTPDAPRPPPTS